MKGQFTRVSVFALLHLFAACDDDPSDQRSDGGGSAGRAGATSDPPMSSAGAGGASGLPLSEAAITTCEKFCAVEAVLSSGVPCETGDLVVRGVLVRRAEGGAGGVAGEGPEPASPPPSSCVEDCLAAQEQGGVECEPPFAAMADCLAEVVWSCIAPSNWRAHDCDIQVLELEECLTQ